MSTLVDARGPQGPGRSELIDHIMRMVVPVRHEFGQSINVSRMVDDRDYARTVFELIHATRNEQLRKEVVFVQNAMFGPRVAAPAVQVQAQAPAAAPAEDEETRRARSEAMGKYRSGLR